MEMYNFAGFVEYKVWKRRIHLPPHFLREIQRVEKLKDEKTTTIYLDVETEPWKISCYPQKSYELRTWAKISNLEDEDPEKLRYFKEMEPQFINLESNGRFTLPKIPEGMKKVVVAGNGDYFIITGLENYERMLTERERTD